MKYHGEHLMDEGVLDIVKPYENNIHCFRPLKDSVIFDLIINDYDSSRAYKEFVQKNNNKNFLKLGIFKKII